MVPSQYSGENGSVNVDTCPDTLLEHHVAPLDSLVTIEQPMHYPHQSCCRRFAAPGVVAPPAMVFIFGMSSQQGNLSPKVVHG